MLNSCQVVTFDCDGVMFDTTDANRAYYNAVLAHFGKPALTPEQFAYSHSHTVHESLKMLFDDPEMRSRADIFRRQMDYQPYINAMQMEPHLKPFLNYLQQNGIKTAVATNRTDSMPRVIQVFELAGLFDWVVTASDVARPKPHPDMLLSILEHFNIRPSEMLYIGDSAVDQEAAEAAGVPLAAFNNTSLRAAFHVSCLSDLWNILGGEKAAL